MSRNKSQGWKETAKTVFYAVLIALVIRTFGYEPFSIPSSSTSVHSDQSISQGTKGKLSGMFASALAYSATVKRTSLTSAGK